MRKKRKTCKLILIIIIIILGLFITKKIINTINYHKTYEYKLLKLGYNVEETKKIDKLNSKTKNYILSIDYNKNIMNIIKQKYFIEKNFKNYLKYINNNNYNNVEDVISIINVGSNNAWYTKTKKTDISKNSSMLTNKFNYLDNTYNSDNMIKISKLYSFGEDQYVTKETYDAFISMFNKAKEENLSLIINSSYRSYKEQEEVYDYYKSILGEEDADKRAARAGYSEHQTGLAIDIQTYGSSAKTFENTDEFKWLQIHAHEYGFILRYPQNKEYLTGYEYESWHYRYVGIEIATYIHENNITFDEYYAYYLD